MNDYSFYLRLIHIPFGVFWAGGAMILAWYIIPAVKNSGPDGPRMMAAITGTNKFPVVLTISATITVVVGWILIYHNIEVFGKSWMGSPMGISLSTGGVLGTIALLIGLTVSKPTVTKIQKISAMIAETGNPPNDEQKLILGRLQNRLFVAARFIAILLAVTVILMAVARNAHMTH
ncbi:MAG: hypothetical protein KG003_03280 [Bacteroidetes bacterium]|nr:hypothetical protein [Bacteroidota bacterium]